MKIFATSYGGSHIKTIKPVIEELAKRGHSCIYMPQTVVTKDEFDGISIVSCHDYIDYTNPEIMKYGKILAEKHHTDGVMEYHKSVAYLGQLFYDNYLEWGEDKTWEVYNKYGLRGLNPVGYMKKVIMHLSPDFVIATNAPRMERAALHAATLLNIKNICIVDFQGLREIDWLKDARCCSSVAVNSIGVYEKLIEAGRDQSSVYITGSPLFEKVSIMFEESLDNNRGGAKIIENSRPVIFFAEQQVSVYKDLSAEMRNKLYATCQKHGWILKIRPHPNTIHKYEETIVDGLIISGQQTAVEDDVLSCDVCVTITSTVGWMALMANKPLLVVTHPTESKYYDVGVKNGAFVLDSIDEMESCLLNIINGRNESKSFMNKMGFADRYPFATRNIVDLIENLT